MHVSVTETLISCGRTKCGLLGTGPESWLRSSYWGSIRWIQFDKKMLFFSFSFTIVSVLSCCRTAPSSSDTAPTRAPGSRTLWPCSTSRRSTTFPSASCRTPRVTPSERRAKRMKRSGEEKQSLSEEVEVYLVFGGRHHSIFLSFSS